MRKLFWLLFALLLSACSKPGQEVVPVTELHLKGKLIFIQFQPGGNQLLELDLATGETRTLFDATGGAQLSAAVVSPDGQRIVLTYSPPEPSGLHYAYTDLYQMPYDRSSPPEPLLEGSQPKESFANPAWSPDGKYVYYTHLFPLEGENESTFQYRIERISLTGQVEIILEAAIWPRLSPDGTKLAFLSIDPENTTNELFLAGPAGENPSRVLPPGEFPAVDAHLFSPDSQSIYFSAVNSDRESTSHWFERLFGITVALAHSAPSDWYRASLGEGEIKRLTYLDNTGMYAALSPSGDHLAFMSATGLYVIEPDGRNLAKISGQLLVGTVDWIP